MDPVLREPLTNSNWVWILGGFLIIIALTWVIGLWLSYRWSKVRPEFKVRSLDQVQRERYRRLIGEIEAEYGSGQVAAREAHLALAAVIRACASERTGLNVESSTPDEAEVMVPSWSLLAEALRWCESESFPIEVASGGIERGVWLAGEVIGS